MENQTKEQTQKPRFMEEVKGRMRLRRLGKRTEKTYLGWIRRFILFHDKKHPRELAEGPKSMHF